MAHQSKGESSPHRRCRPGRVGSAAEAKMDALGHLRALGSEVRPGRGYLKPAMCLRRPAVHETQALSHRGPQRWLRLGPGPTAIAECRTAPATIDGKPAIETLFRAYEA